MTNRSVGKFLWPSPERNGASVARPASQLLMLWRHSSQFHESKPLDERRHLYSYISLVVEGLRHKLPEEALV